MSWLLVAFLLLQQASATFYFTLTNSYVNTETAVYVYYKPASASAYTECNLPLPVKVMVCSLLDYHDTVAAGLFLHISNAYNLR